MPKKAPDLMRLYRALLNAFGPQHWWPGETPFEVMVGAILTQNTAWRNVERAIEKLKTADLLSPVALAHVRKDRLARCIRPSGYFNQKATRLKNFARWLMKRADGDVQRLFSETGPELREELLALTGIGPETADSMLLYAAERPVFVVDAYTRRVFSRHGFVSPEADYEEIRAFFEGNLPADAALFNELHALIVALGKDICRPTPKCAECPVRKVMASVGEPYAGEVAC